jgi:hypothetical protein
MRYKCIQVSMGDLSCRRPSKCFPRRSDVILSYGLSNSTRDIFFPWQGEVVRHHEPTVYDEEKFMHYMNKRNRRIMKAEPTCDLTDIHRRDLKKRFSCLKFLRLKVGFWYKYLFLEHNLKGGCDVRAVCGEQRKKEKTILSTSIWNVYFRTFLCESLPQKHKAISCICVYNKCTVKNQHSTQLNTYGVDILFLHVSSLYCCRLGNIVIIIDFIN